ncbi:phospholipase D-like domain-containing protein [Streptomyces sp. NPDC060209]|uniref:phospholipase D-like domain-containing protein n=1 Tax=Streptomyces sp. NPDC060209 TaxID=3347073 RepID=UPI0036657A2E
MRSATKSPSASTWTPGPPTTADNTGLRRPNKFLAIDHHLLLVTSANFSWSAENNNVEFGVLIDNPNLTEAVERELRETEGVLYERIS